jgi:D-inositol-3-phosphate glycosyltransferase
MSKRIKILVVADMVTRTGFSRVMEGIFLNLPKDDYEIVGLGINSFGDPHNLPFKVYPALTPATVQIGDVYGINRIPDIVNREHPDIIFLLNDIWVLSNYFKVFKEMFTKGRPKIVCYFPVDARDHAKHWYDNVDVVDRLVTYTQFAKNVATAACPDREFEVIPHGIDSKTFYKITDIPKSTIKATLFPGKPQFYEDSFIILNANRNQPRKKLWVTMEAFKLFSENKPENVRLYMHAGIRDADIDMAEFAIRLGIDSRLHVTSLVDGPQQVSEEKLNRIYNSCEIGVNSCYTPDTGVLTKSGYKNIGSVEKGETVYSHTGKESKVSDVFSYDYSGKILKVTPFGAYPISLTPNHKLFADIRQYTHVFKWHKTEIRDNPQPRFIRADELLEGSVLTFPVIKKEDSIIGKEKAFIYGAYLAEGCKTKGGVVFSLNSQEPDDFLRESIITYMKNVYDLDAHKKEYTQNRQTLSFYSSILEKEFELLFGKGAHNKRIPEELLSLVREDKVSLLKGYFLGDGHISQKSKTLSFTTVSESLAKSVWFLLTTLGNIAPALQHKTRGEWVITVNGESARELANVFGLELRIGAKQQRDKMWADSNYVYYPISKIETTDYSGKIHDLEVEGEHSYLTYVSGHNSMGEGWGLCGWEHGATGAPQIVPENSANTELYSDCGLLVPTIMDEIFKDIMTRGSLIRPEDMAKEMERLYTDKSLYNDLSTKILEKTHRLEYQWPIVALLWDKIFKEEYGKI